jgi:membrane fusion protein, multidrug efflux system
LLFPNQFVNIQLLVNVLHDQIIIPNVAVHRGAPKGVLTSFVYLVNSDSTVSVRPVTLGTSTAIGSRSPRDSSYVGDRVVTEGGDRLRDGAAVELPGAAPAAAPRAARPKSK